MDGFFDGKNGCKKKMVSSPFSCLREGGFVFFGGCRTKILPTTDKKQINDWVKNNPNQLV